VPLDLRSASSMRTRRSQAGASSSTKSGGGGEAGQRAAAIAASLSAIHGSTNSDDGLTALERERLIQIQRNRERMMQPDIAAPVGLPTADSEKPPIRRGVGGSRKRQRHSSEPVMLRRSTRQRGEAADPFLSQGVDYETKTGAVVLAAQGAAADSPDEGPAMAPAAELPFKSMEADEDSDAAFLKSLRAAVVMSSGRSGGIDEWEKRQHSASKSYSMREEHVRKVLVRAVTMMDFAPLPGNQILVAAGDKGGHLGIWDVEKTDITCEGDDGASLLFQPHRTHISGLSWCPGGSGLYTVSYDGSLRFLDVEKGVFGLSHHSMEDEYSAMDVAHAEGLVFLADNGGFLKRMDLKSGSVDPGLKLHSNKINSVQVEPSGRPLLATSSTDSSVCVWDLRKMGSKSQPLAQLLHGKSSHGAFWSPADGDSPCRLATISFDDTVRVYEPSLTGNGFVKAWSARHNNHTGRWVLPLKPRWSPAGDAIAVGSMRRGIDLLDSSTGDLLRNVNSEYMTAIPPRVAFHPQRNILAGATSSGRVNIFM